MPTTTTSIVNAVTCFGLSTATITASGANKVNVSGNLTIKGKTNPVTFPATYTMAGNTLTVVASEVKVDRTLYDIRYGSKSFFESIGDKAIDNEFLLNITLVATK